MSSALERRIARLEAQKAAKTAQSEAEYWPFITVSNSREHPDRFGYEDRLWSQEELYQHVKPQCKRIIFIHKSYGEI